MDTNVLSEPLLPTPNRGILERLRNHQDEVAIASVVCHELLFGCYRLPHSARVNGLILVTANVTDYATFQDIQVVDWRS